MDICNYNPAAAVWTLNMTINFYIFLSLSLSPSTSLLSVVIAIDVPSFILRNVFYPENW